MLVGVTGSQGFIGTWVVNELKARGHNVIAVDHSKRDTSTYDDSVELMLADVCDRTAMTEMVAHVDGVIHLAAILGTQETVKNPHPAAEVNILGGLNILTACEQYNVPLVNICVGNYWMLNTYSSTKRCFERLVDMYGREHGLPVANVRCVNAYGPGQRAAPPFAPGRVRKIMPAFICRALSGLPIEVYGDGTQVSDMVWVGDVARTLVSALEKLEEGLEINRVIECGPVFSSTVNEVAELVVKEAGFYTAKEVEIVHLPMRPGENVGDKVTCNGYTLADVGITLSSLRPLEIGIGDTVEYFLKNKGKTWNSPNE